MKTKRIACFTLCIALSAFSLSSCTSLYELKQKLHNDMLPTIDINQGEFDDSQSTNTVEENEKELFEYRLIEDGENKYYALEKYNGNDLKVTVPSTYKELKVQSIFANAFGDNVNVNSVRVSYGITSLGDYAFYGCSNLEELNIATSVTSVGAKAFAGCASLQAIMLPTSVTSIGESAFADNTSLSSVSLSSGLTVLPHGLFENCTALTYSYVPKAVTRIESKAYKNCRNLTRIDIYENVSYIAEDAFDGCGEMTFLCVKDSYAEEYAVNKGYKVIYHQSGENTAEVTEEN